jgi:hypothetical protein
MGLAGLTLAAAVAVSHAGVTRPVQTAYTQLWLLPDERAATPPAATAAAATPAVRLGIRNFEPATATYTLRLTAGGQLLGEWPGISLERDGVWETTARLPRDESLDPSSPVEASLYRAGDPDTVFRRVTFWPASPSADPTTRSS